MFIQIGANDGIHDDPLRDLVLKWHFKGILVEPLPDVFAALVSNYAAEKQLLFENCAIADKDGQVIMYGLIDEEGKDPGRFGEKASVNPSIAWRAASFHGDRKIRQTSVSVVGMTVSSLFRKHMIATLPLLVIDAEGYECAAGT